jgi:hypothetical protein
MSDYENRLEQGLTQRLNRDSAERENQRLAAVREEQRKRERAAQEAEAKRVARERSLAALERSTPSARGLSGSIHEGG